MEILHSYWLWICHRNRSEPPCIKKLGVLAETRQLVVTRIVYIFHFVRHVLRWLFVMFADLVLKLVMNGGTVHHDLDTLVFRSS